LCIFVESVKTMKTLLFAFCLLCGAAGFAGAQNYGEMTARTVPEWFVRGYTYQIQLRAFTPEGTLKAAAARLPQLKDIGVGTVYLCPVFVTDDDMNQAGWSARQIKSGYGNPKNPYRISDYFHVDEEYGTDDDLREFVHQAHSHGLKVLLDIVYTHCGPRAVFMEEHPEFFSYDSEGKIKLTDWNFPGLNFESESLRTYLKTNMLYFVCDFGVDGFRCDVADAVPLDFWEEARVELEKVNPDIVIAAEGQRRSNTLKAFDANYDWEIVLNCAFSLLKNPDAYRDKGGAAAIRKQYESYMSEFPKGTLFWHFTENHDTSNDSYDNRVEAVYGHDNQELGLALCFALDGIPLVYNGQEICDASRHSIFSTSGAACIDWNRAGEDYAVRRSGLLREWARMRRERSCLVDGAVVWIENNHPDKVLSFKRSDGKSEDVVFVANFSGKKVDVRLEDGTKYKLAPWGYVFEDALGTQDANP